MKISALTARQILDSRGNPTVEVEMRGAAGTVRALVPSGASTGVYEAKELRDRGAAWRGLGVTQAVRNVRGPIAKAVVGKQFADQRSLDNALLKLDGTADKSRLGANAILGVSMAFCRLHALDAGKPLYRHIASVAKSKPRLPVVYANVINGGKHAGNGLAFQEFMIVPRAKTFGKAIQDVVETYHALKDSIARRYGPSATGVGDEGGFAPSAKRAEDCLSLLEEASGAAGTKLSFALDAAASEFYAAKAKQYLLPAPKREEQLAEYYEQLIKDHPLRSLEDPFEQHAFSAFAHLRDRLKRAKLSCQIVGDDLTVTNPLRIRQAAAEGSCDCLLLKVNQIGSVSEALDAWKLARDSGWNVMVSHRSGETDDAFISHLVVGLGTGQAKIGAPCRGERVAKYNELLRIAEDSLPYAP